MRGTGSDFRRGIAVGVTRRIVRGATVRRWVVAVGMLALLGAAGVAFHRSGPAPADVWRSVRALDPFWALVAIGAQAASLVAFAEQQRGVVAAVGGRLSFPRGVYLTFARTAVSVSLPGGGAVSTAFAVRQFRRGGVAGGVAAAIAVVTGVQSVITIALIYVGWFATLGTVTARGTAVRPVVGALVVLVVAGAAWLVLREADGHLARGDPAGTAPARPATRRGWRARVRVWLVDGVHAAAGLSAGAWARGLGAAAANWVLDVGCLLATAQACHARAGVLAVVGGYLAVQLLRQVPITPGGVGLVEAGLFGALVAGGATAVTATGAVVIYRLLSCWLIVLIGLPAAFELRIHRAHRRSSTSNWHGPRGFVPYPRAPGGREAGAADHLREDPWESTGGDCADPSSSPR